jgi:hypothetical protein
VTKVLKNTVMEYSFRYWGSVRGHPTHFERACPSSHVRMFSKSATPSITGGRAITREELTMLAIILAGAAIVREREHGTMDHLLVMPLTPFDDVQGLGERLGDHGGGRPFPLHRSAHHAWDAS